MHTKKTANNNNQLFVLFNPCGLREKRGWLNGRCRRKRLMAANTEALIHRSYRRELIRVAKRRLEMSSGTYASRVQQVSPSTSPPGTLSVLTDSFSLAGMLTGRGRGAERERCGKKRDGWINRRGLSHQCARTLTSAASPWEAALNSLNRIMK